MTWLLVRMKPGKTADPGEVADVLADHFTDEEVHVHEVPKEEIKHYEIFEEPEDTER